MNELVCLVLLLVSMWPHQSLQDDGSEDHETPGAPVASESTLQSLVFWPNGTVPFFIDNEHFDNEQGLSIMSTLADFTYKSCLRFLPVFALPPGAHVLHIVNPSGLRGCHFGRAGHSTDAPHTLVLGYECLTSPHVEMMVMRALGFSFEHNRALRDLYVDVLLENVEPGAVDMYTKDLKLPEELRRLPYDPHSVLHFAERDNTKNGHRTIMFRNKQLVQNRKGLTDGDIRKIHAVYGPECRRRDRANQLEECQKYATANRRKRDTVVPIDCVNFLVRAKRSASVAKNKTDTRKDEEELTVNLRANPDITPDKDVTKLSDKNTKREGYKREYVSTTLPKGSTVHSLTTDKPAKGTADLQVIINKINKLKSIAVDNARKAKCKTNQTVDDHKDSKTDAEDIAKSVIEYIATYIHDVTKSASFCGNTTFRAIEREGHSTKLGELITEKHNEEHYKSTRVDHKRVQNHSTKVDKVDSRRAASTRIPRKGQQTKHRGGNRRSNNAEEFDVKVPKTNRVVLSVNAGKSRKENVPENGLRSASDASVHTDSNSAVAKAYGRSSLSVNADDSKSPNDRRRRATGADSNPVTNIGLGIENDARNSTSVSNDDNGEGHNKNDTSKVLRFDTNSKSLKVVPVNDLKTEKEDDEQDTVVNQQETENVKRSKAVPPSSTKDETKPTLFLNTNTKNEDTVTKVDTHAPKLPKRRQILGRHRPIKREPPSNVGQHRMTSMPEYLDQSPEDNFRDYSDRFERYYRRRGSLRTVDLSKGNKEFYYARRWTDGIVRYIIKENQKYDLEDLRSRLGEVNDILKKFTCVRLQEIKERDSKKYEDYLVLDPTTEDYVTGKVGGRQMFGSLELFQGGQPKQHTAMIVMSMLGFYFENSRHDRDNYIRVHNRHIRADKLHHFDKLTEDATLPLPYDFDSATHPAWQFWRKPGKTGISSVATFKKLDSSGEVMRSLGQHDQLLSDLDIVKINSVYGTQCLKN